MREDWVKSLARIAYPVLQGFAVQEKSLPRENVPEGRNVCYLEALGRTLCGLAPWLEAELPDGPERQEQLRFRLLAQQALANATNPESPVFLDFAEDYQNIVDAAFLAQGLLRAPHVLWEELPPRVKRQVIACMKKQRIYRPFYSNWLCFSAIIEAFLQMAGEPDWDPMRVDYAIRTHEKWFLGDGVYGDGSSFAFNYYNSFVIQPMLVDMLEKDTSGLWEEFRPRMLERASRGAHHLEELIMPDGRFPVIGRSSCYRYGAFHLLAQAMLRQDNSFAPGSVRAAMEAMIRQVEDTDTMFDEHGFLTIGVHGHQPERGEAYINTGSLYLCSTVFLPLGLTPDAPFWREPDAPWTQCRVWE